MSFPVPKVSVAIMAYNHEKYIAQAIDSVLAQEVSFPIEIVIGEDESTDATRAICQEYAARHPDIIRLILRSRNDPARQKYTIPVMFNICETYQACRGDYIAYLDGDDYWTDTQKLAVQATLLDEHPEYTFCGHRYQRLYEPQKELVADRFDNEYRGHDHRIVTYDDFMDPPLLLCSFMMLRRSAMEGYFNKECGWDNLLWAHLLSKGGKAIVLNRYMGVYRKHAGGVWSSMPNRQLHKISHSLQTLLVKNEGFRSKCVTAAYCAGAVERSGDLADETVESLRAWQAHALDVITVIGRETGRPPSRLAAAVSRSLCAVQERLLRTQAAYLSLNCPPGQSGGARLARLLRLGLLVIVASPLMLFVALIGSPRQVDPAPTPKQT